MQYSLNIAPFFYVTDDQWEWIHQFLLSHPPVYVGNPERCRQFINAVLWMLRSGSQWRSLPPSYGNWNSIFKRYDRWADVGVWDDLLTAASASADLQKGFIDSTVVRAHACAAGAKKAMPRRKHWDDQKGVSPVKSMP